MIGNHDWKSNADCRAFDEAFPRSRNYAFEQGGWQFVGLDSSHGTRSRVAVQPEALRWLDDNLGRLDLSGTCPPASWTRNAWPCWRTPCKTPEPPPS